MKKVMFVFLLLFVLADSAYAGISVLGGLTLEKTLKPGDTHEGTIQLLNTGEEMAQVVIAQTDYFFNADGSTYYDDPNSRPRSNAGWISFSPSRITIPAGATVSIYYEVKVPPDPDLVGTYWSVLMIEPMADETPPVVEERDGKITLGVQTIIRYAIQMITNIEETGESSIELLNVEIVNLDGNKVLRADIVNAGERWLRPAVWLELYDVNGQYVGRFKSDIKRIFPGCSVSHQLELNGVPNGQYTAIFIVDNGDDRIFGANYEVRLEK